MASPFTSFLNAPDLPPIFKKQFFPEPGKTGALELSGIMDQVWQRHRWLWPLLFLLSRVGLFFPESGVRVPVQMKVFSEADPSGREVHHWNRTFHFSKTTRFLNTDIAAEAGLGKIVEAMGSGRFLRMIWEFQFSAPDTLHISVSRSYLDLGPWKIFLPRFFSTEVRAVETALSDRSLHIDLKVSHPLLGDLFGYTGTFEISSPS